MKKNKVIFGFLLIAMAVAIVLFIKFGASKPSLSNSVGAVKVKGSTDAPVQIVVFSDFQCPACRAVKEPLDKLMAQFPGQIAVTFKHFPLGGHLWAGLAHQAAECSAEQGKFWQYHDKLYAVQMQWTGPMNPTETFLRYGKEIRLDLNRFATCLSSEETQKAVMSERKQGESLNVNSTPTLFMNDVRLVGPIQVAQRGEAVVREALGLPPVQTPETDKLITEAKP